MHTQTSDSTFRPDGKYVEHFKRLFKSETQSPDRPKSRCEKRKDPKDIEHVFEEQWVMKIMKKLPNAKTPEISSTTNEMIKYAGSNVQWGA